MLVLLPLLCAGGGVGAVTALLARGGRQGVLLGEQASREGWVL